MNAPFSAQIDPIILKLAARPCGVALAEVPHDQPNNDAVGCRMSKMVKKGLLVSEKIGNNKRYFTTADAAAALVQSGVPDDIMKDAKRYRWLRASTFPKADQYPYRISTKPIRLPIGFDDQSTFDAAIDAAMLTAPTGQKGNI